SIHKSGTTPASAPRGGPKCSALSCTRRRGTDGKTLHLSPRERAHRPVRAGRARVGRSGRDFQRTFATLVFAHIRFRRAAARSRRVWIETGRRSVHLRSFGWPGG